MPPIPYTQFDYDAAAGFTALANAQAATAAGVAAGLFTTGPWAVPAWFIDPLNGSDSNDGKTGPTAFKSYARLLQEWGTSAPILDADVTVTYLTAPPVPDDDPIVFDGGGAGSISFLGPPLLTILVAEAALQSFAARDRSAATPHIQSANQNWMPYNVGQFIVNQTRGSNAFVYKGPQSGTVTFSQPMTPALVPPASPQTFVEDNTWAEGDIIDIHVLPTVHVLRASFAASGGSAKGINFYHLNLGQGGSPGYFGDFVRIYECYCAGEILLNTQILFGFVVSNSNIALLSGANIGPAQEVNIRGGCFGSLNVFGANIDDDTILGNGFHSIQGSSVIFNLCVDSASGGLLIQGAALCDHRQSTLPSPPVFWGVGTVTATYSSLLYTEPATTAFTNANGAGLRIGTNSVGFAISVSGGAVSILGSGTTGRALTTANLDADIGSGGFHTSGHGTTAIGPAFEGTISSVGI